MKRNLIVLLLLLMADWIYARSLVWSHENSKVDSDCLKEQYTGLKVFLTVSSLVHVTHGSLVQRQLEMNWYGEKIGDDDKVALYNTDPLFSVVDPLVVIRPKEFEKGYYRTNITFPRVTFTIHNLTNDCLGYWIAYISQKDILYVNCLRAWPYWINEHRKYIDSFTLREVMLPGSHDAGSYSYYNHNNIFDRYIYAQEERIFEQLAYGIRHFDIRAAYYDNLRPAYWINHDKFRTNNTLLEVLTDVVNFVKKTRELVILDFHGFPYGIVSRRDHENLIEYIFDILQDNVIPFDSTKTNIKIGDILNGEQRILVAYNHPHHSTDRGLWPPLCQVWGDKSELTDLKDYFSFFFSKRGSPSYLWSSMAELTPNLKYIIEHTDGGLREMADQANRVVSRWFRDLWWKSPNIVATDYVMGNNMVEIAIEINKKRKLCGISFGKQIIKELTSFCSEWRIMFGNTMLESTTVR